MKLHRLFTIAAVAACAALPARADKVTLNFDGQDNQGIPKATDADGKPLPGQDFGPLVLGYYNGDGRKGSQDFGVTLSDQAVAICAPNTIDGCFGNFGTPPSGNWAVGAIEAGADSFDLWIAPDFVITELAFSYNDTGTQSKPGLTLYNQQTAVKTVQLKVCESLFCGWREYSEIGLADLAITRISFLGAPNSVFFDNVTLNTSRQQPPPLPEPSTTALLALGLAAMGCASRRRHRR